MRSANEVVESDLAHMSEALADDFARMAGKNLLIVGGAGFLGYYLVQSVLHWNRSVDRAGAIDVTVYDNYIRGVPEWLSGLEGRAGFRSMQHDINDPLPTDAGPFHYIVHAASIASPTYYRKHPIETMDANVNGLRNLLDHCLRQRDAGVPVDGFLFYSTSEIYGDPTPDQIPTPETYRGNVSCTGPRACYDESKRYGETLCVNFARQYELPIGIARPFNNYGPGLKITDKRVLPDFARNVLSGNDIVMHSDGRPTRTFCYIADAIVGYYRIMTRGRPGEAYNIGTESPEISMRELAAKVIERARDLFGYEGRAIFEASHEDDYLVDNPNRRCPVIDKARAELGYDPRISIDEGLERTLLWYKSNSSAAEA